MSFFNDLGKKIASTSQNVTQKTKEFAEVAKLNAKISDEQKTLNSYYQQLGEQYYNCFADQPAEGFAQYCDCIRDTKERIAALESSVRKAKNIQTCPNCGAACNSNLLFCGSCGTALPKEAKKLCSQCASELDEDSVFCPSCGARQEETVEEAPKQNVCPGCGSPLDEDAMFCTNCGQKI